VNSLGFHEQSPVPPVRKIPDRDGGMTRAVATPGIHPASRGMGALSRHTSDA